MRYIGDVHGKFRKYKKIISTVSESIQVGDMGVGFIDVTTDQPYANPPFDTMSKGNHRFIRGNHDSPKVCAEHRFCIKDGAYENDTMFIGGGLSIDRAYRTENYTWWADEEISYAELLDIQNYYLEMKPKTMVTHDCPEIIADEVLGAHNLTKFHDPSRTRHGLQAMWEGHKPDLWIFGHWHYSLDIVRLGTRFICLAELEYKDI